MQKKIFVVADDFTGANDTGVQFAKAGLKVKVIIDTSAISKEIEQCDVIVVDLESRLLSSEEAYAKSFVLGAQLNKIGDCIVYKKLDSTFRGNIGAELDGLMNGMQLKIALLAAALPAMGRTTENGEVYVHGVKVADTEARNDPRTPVKHSRIEDIIGIQSKRVRREISTDFFEDEPVARNNFISKEIENGSEIFIFDTYNESDLENVAEFIAGINYIPFLLVGSAGLAMHLSQTSLFSKPRFAFVFAGSISEKTRGQIRYTIDEGNCNLMCIDGEKLLVGNLEMDVVIATVTAGIFKGDSRFIFTSSLDHEDVQRVYESARQRNLSPDEAAGKLSVGMGYFAAELIKKFNPYGVLLTGGETAINTVNALGATGIEIDREILPGVQSGTLTGCSIRSVITTKAGGFGEHNAISKTFQFLKV